MLNVQLRLKNELFFSCEIFGHAAVAPAGQDILCSAATVLLRTAARVLMFRYPEKIQVLSSGRGHLKVSIMETSDMNLLWLSGVSEFLTAGYKDLEEQYPDNLVLEIIEEEVKHYGS